VARVTTPVATLAPWSKATRAAVWFEAKRVAAAMRMTIPSRGGNVAGMARDVSKLLAAALGTFA
jgi:hypothetical protein